MSLLLGGLIAGGIGAVKSIFGGVQASKGAKDLKRQLANRPKYNIPQEYAKALGIYSNLAQGEMPGQQRYEDLIGQSTARAMTNAERGAISSNVYQGSVLSAQDKELEALQNLAQMGAQYKVGAMKDLAGAQTQYGQLQDQAFDYNVNQPWQMKTQMASEQKQAGMQNLFSGLGEMGGAVMSLVGTKYYTDALKGMQGGQGTPANAQGLITGNNPIGGGMYNPQANLLETLSGLKNK